MWNEYFNATRLEEVIEILAEKREQARVVAGATDLMLEMERGVRKGITTLIDITRIPLLDQITLDENGWIHLGPMVTHNHCVASKLIREHALPLAQAAWQVGSPQIRNRGTIAGNLITASPANDTITPLMALDAQLTLRSKTGERKIPLKSFYSGVRRTNLLPDEMLVDIAFPAMTENQAGMFIKFGLRRAQAISLVNVAVILQMVNGLVESARVTLGSVAPTIIHAIEAEQYLTGKYLNGTVAEAAARLASKASKPINDIRGSAAYRKVMARVITKRALNAIESGAYLKALPESPVLLWGKKTYEPSLLAGSLWYRSHTALSTTINGKTYNFDTGQNKSLLRLLREEAGLVGSKEGCAEGECGACTVFLDGAAVMSCLVPAPRAHGAEVVTIEGLASGEKLHPVQEAFIAEDAVQCGYCSPGFVMAGAKLLEEKSQPSRTEIEHAITGNLCRCTGYYNIIHAIDRAASAPR